MSAQDRIEATLREGVANGCFPGAVCALARGDDVEVVTVGDIASHDDTGSPIPADARLSVTEDVRYDLASVTKVFSAIAILTLVDDGILSLEAPVADWLPEYRAARKTSVTLAQLLTHTSGLPGTWGGWHGLVADEGTDRARWMPADRAEVLTRILDHDLDHDPGEAFEYSCLGYITAMAVAESATGRSWDRLVCDRVLDPLGLAHTSFGPITAPVAPTEYQAEFGRGMVRSVVHDETAFALAGVSANAGLFSTAADMVVLGKALLDDLEGILTPDSFRQLWEDRLPDLLGPAASATERENGFGQSIGLRIGRNGWLGGHAVDARGHSGFTGTQLVADPGTHRVMVLLSNRVHPHRDGPDLAPVRAALAQAALRN